MLDTGQDFSLRRAIAFELVGDEHPWYVGQALEQLPEELLGGRLVSPTLAQDIEDMAVMIRGPPEVVAFTTDRQEDLVEMPLVAWSRAPATQLIGVLLAKFATPLADRLAGHGDASDEQQLLHIAVTEAESVVEPPAMADDFDREREQDTTRSPPCLRQSIPTRGPTLIHQN
jgi:hypothetical protein